MDQRKTNRIIDKRTLFLKCYALALIQWNILEVNIDHLIVSICQPNDDKALNAAISSISTTNVKIKMLSEAIDHCNHDKKVQIKNMWSQQKKLFGECQNARNLMAHNIMIHTPVEEHLGILLIDNIFRYPRKNTAMDIIEIQNFQLKFFALSNQLEKLRFIMTGEPDIVPADFIEIKSVSSLKEIAERHGYDRVVN